MTTLLPFAGWSHNCLSLSSPQWCATASFRNRSYPCIGSFCARHRTSRASYREYAMISVPTLRSRRLTSCTLNIFIGEANDNLNCLKMSTLNNLDHSASLKITADHSHTNQHLYSDISTEIFVFWEITSLSTCITPWLIYLNGKTKWFSLFSGWTRLTHNGFIFTVLFMYLICRLNPYCLVLYQCSFFSMTSSDFNFL